MSNKATDEIASERLLESLQRMASRNNFESVALSGFVQANLSFAMTTALFNLFKTKNLIGTAELEKALADAYNERANQIDRESIAIAMPVPSISRGN